MNELRADLLDDYDSRFGGYFRKSVIRYIEERRLEDGGYFFARVLPSSGMDTYFAVKSLSILGTKPDHPQKTAEFLLDDLRDTTFGGLTGIFITAEVLNDLGYLTNDLRNSMYLQIMKLENVAGGFGAFQDLDLEVPSELRSTYRAVKVLRVIGADLDERKISKFVLQGLNSDGGYGAKGYSTLASTFYAIAINKLLGLEMRNQRATKLYLRKREENWQVQFIEDL
jgi:hypothetical protein